MKKPISLFRILRIVDRDVESGKSLSKFKYQNYEPKIYIYYDIQDNIIYSNQFNKIRTKNVLSFAYFTILSFSLCFEVYLTHR